MWRFQVRLDRGTLLRVSGDQRLPIAYFIIGDVEGEVGVDEFFERRGHLLPPHTEPSDEVKQLAAPVAGGHTTHVMQPDVPGAMAGACEAVGEPAEPKMALKHQDALALELSHQARDSQPPDAGTDDDEVKVPVVWSHATFILPRKQRKPRLFVRGSFLECIGPTTMRSRNPVDPRAGGPDGAASRAIPARTLPSCYVL